MTSDSGSVPASTPRPDTPLRVRLAVTPEAGGGPALARFPFDAAGGGAGDLATDQRWLGGDYSREYWHAGPVVERGEGDGLQWSASAELLLVSLAVANSGDADPAAASEDGYRRLIACARRLGYPQFLRIWNFIPQINHGRGDDERYRRFCVGRTAALQAAGLASSELGAATAVGIHGHHLHLHALAGRGPGVAIENPRQVSAYRYPRAYGPSRPAFARALALPLEPEGAALMVSGTASIVGHESRHPRALEPQIDEMQRNVETLVEAAAARLERPGLARLGGNTLVRVYVRRSADWPLIAERLRTAWPRVHLVGLEAEICRRELLVEVELFHSA